MVSLFNLTHKGPWGGIPDVNFVSLCFAQKEEIVSLADWLVAASLLVWKAHRDWPIYAQVTPGTRGGYSDTFDTIDPLFHRDPPWIQFCPPPPPTTSFQRQPLGRGVRAAGGHAASPGTDEIGTPEVETWVGSLPDFTVSTFHLFGFPAFSL